MQLFPVDYSSLSVKALLQLVISNYGVSANATITFLKRGFNDTYLINSTTEKYILRVYKHNWRSFASIQTEISLLSYLNKNKVNVSHPIKSKAGGDIQTLQSQEGERYAVLFSFAEGEQIRKLTVEQSYLLGIETGKIHSLTANLSLGLTAQNYDVTFQFETILNTLKPVLINHSEEFNYLLKLQKDFSNIFSHIDKNEVAIGICHGDLQAENFHITNDKLTFFDFDFFGTGYLAYDIGVFIWYDHKNKPPEIINSFLKGYKTQRPLSTTEVKLLPYFSTLRALFQMTLYCRLNDGQHLPLWPIQEVANFIRKVERWFQNAEQNS